MSSGHIFITIDRSDIKIIAAVRATEILARRLAKEYPWNDDMKYLASVARIARRRMMRGIGK